MYLMITLLLCSKMTKIRMSRAEHDLETGHTTELNDDVKSNL